ncbi:hypothetical protein DSO57_1034888, partial [Entomophthora muscae]
LCASGLTSKPPDNSLELVVLTVLAILLLLCPPQPMCSVACPSLSPQLEKILSVSSML